MPADARCSRGGELRAQRLDCALNRRALLAIRVAGTQHVLGREEDQLPNSYRLFVRLNNTV